MCKNTPQRNRASWSPWFIAAACFSLMAFATAAYASPQESVTFNTVISGGTFVTAIDTRTTTFVGTYAPKSIRLTATLNKVNAGTFRSEARVYVTPPSGAGFELQPALQGSFTGPTVVTDDLVLPIPTPLSSAAGLWTFKFYESFDDGADGLEDSNWSSIEFTLDDALPDGLTTLSGPSPYLEVEPNDNTFPNNSTNTSTTTGTGSIYGGANMVASMAVGESVEGTTTGTLLTTPGGTSADNFLIRVATDTPDIYKYQLSLTTTGTVGHTATLRGFSQNTDAGVGVPGVVLAGSDSSFQTHVLSGTTRVNQWYGFGKGENVRYRVTGGTTTTSPYSAVLSRSTVTPIAIGGTIYEGTVVFSRATGNTATVDMILFDSSLNPIVGSNFHSMTTATMSRTLVAGTYYLAVSNAVTANSQASAADSTSRTNLVATTPDFVINSSATAVANMNVQIASPAGPVVSTGGAKAAAFDVVWYQFTVVPLPTEGACCTGDACNIVQEGTCGGTYYGNGSLCAPNTCVAACCHDNICEDKNLGDCTALSGVWNQNQACAPGGSFFCPPPNDNCVNVTPVVLTANVPHAFTGDNRGSTNDCAAFAGGQVWEAFTLDNTCTLWEVKLDYCTTSPAFANAWLNLATSCPCSTNTAAGAFNTTECGDGNVTIRWVLPPGTYYYPVLMSSTTPIAFGPYTINVVARCGYCDSRATSTADENIQQFTLNTINQVNPATGWCDTYNDFTASSTSLQAGLAYPFTLVIGDCEGTSCFGKRVAIFIDLNQDFVFDPINERLYNSGQLANAPCPVVTVNGNITIPPASLLGLTRLRVVVLETGSVDPSPCGTYTWGATEDFTVNILAPSPEGACCAPNGTCSIAIEAECIAPSTFGGLGTDCSNPDLCKGKCCQSDGTCTLEGPANCVAPDVFGGIGTNCTGAVCTGRCCLPDGECFVGSIDDCSANAGVLTLGLDCSSVTVLTYPVSLVMNDPDAGGTPVSNVQTVSGMTGTITDLDVDLAALHTWVGDVRIQVEHLGVIAIIYDRPGVIDEVCCGCASDNFDIILDDEGTGGTIEATCNATAPSALSPPNFIPNVALSVYDGMDPNGDWTITAADVEPAGADTGTLTRWSLHISTNAPVCPLPEVIVDCSAGDMNRDGDLNGLDTQKFADVAVGTNTDPQAVCDADVDGDGDVDQADVIALVDREVAAEDYTINAPAAPPCDGSSVSITINPAVAAGNLLFVRNKGAAGDCDVKAQAYNAANVAIGPNGGWTIKPKGAKSLPVGTVRVDYNCPNHAGACNCVVGP